MLIASNYKRVHFLTIDWIVTISWINKNKNKIIIINSGIILSFFVQLSYQILTHLTSLLWGQLINVHYFSKVLFYIKLCVHFNVIGVAF